MALEIQRITLAYLENDCERANVKLYCGIVIINLFVRLVPKPT